MKLPKPQIEKLVRSVFERLKDRKIIEFKSSEQTAFDKSVAYVEAEFRKADDLVIEVHRMLDDLEEKNPGSFDRHKMFILIKNKLTKDRGLVV